MECLLYGLLVHWVEFFSSLVLSVLYSSMLIPQMPPRHDPSNNNNVDAVQQLITAQAEMMQMMTQFFQNQNQNQNQNNNNNPPPAPPPVDRLTRFLRLRPNRFSTATEPIVADEWLRSVNKDLVA